MHQPRPYGLHAIGLPLTERDESFIASVAKRITNLRELSKVDSLKMVYDLPDGGYVIVQDMGGNFRVISHKSSPQKSVFSTGIATSSIPMLYSGVVTRSILEKGQGMGMSITNMCRRRLIGYDDKTPLPDKDIELQRFRIRYSDSFSEFKPKVEGAVLRTQYHQLRPTWYSGAMAEVIQIVGGYGKQEVEPNVNNPFEPIKMFLPTQVHENIDLELGGIRLPGFTGEPPASGQFSYDYKFNKNHSIGFDKNKKPWLLQIDRTGVWAMPLPIIPATATRTFRKYIESVEDHEIIKILDRFGAMPSGEPMPYGSDMQAWVRAGVIIKVCDSSDFYDHIAYSSAGGWAINASGNEGYNTCYDYYDDEGLGYGLTYKLKLNLQPALHYSGAPEVVVEPSDYKTKKAIEYLTEITPLLSSGSNETRAILYKLRLASTQDIYERSVAAKGFDDYQYWNNLVLEPMAEHTGKMSEVYRGYLYHHAKFKFQPQIKFPEPVMNGCISHDFLPLENGRYKDKYPNSDTIMHTYYIGDSLKVIKYFIDWSSWTSEGFSNFENEMYVGSWSKEETIGSSSLHGYFYTSDIDNREAIAPVEVRTDIVGTDRGYDSKPRFSFDAYFSMSGSMTRYRYYSHKTNYVRTEGRMLDISICIPFFCRSAVIHAQRETTQRIVRSESQLLYSQQDPTYYRFWTYDAVFAWNNMTIKKPKGLPVPKNGSPVWVEEEAYNTTLAENFADNGSWIPALPQDYTWLIHPNNNEWNHSGGGGAPYVDYYVNNDPHVSSSSRKMEVSHGGQHVLLRNEPSEKYFISSPDPDDPLGIIFYKDATKVVFGDSDYCNISEPSNNNPMTYWGHCDLVDHKSAHHFIGVINE